MLLALRDLLDKQLQYEAQDRDSFLGCRAERSADCFGGAILSRHVLRHCGILEPARPAHVRDAQASDGLAGQELPKRSCGRTIPISAMPRPPTWARRATRSTSASSAGKSSARRGPIGFGTDRGTVAAADDWDGPMKIKTVRPAHRESYERLCRDAASAASCWTCGKGSARRCDRR